MNTNKSGKTIWLVISSIICVALFALFMPKANGTIEQANVDATEKVKNSDNIKIPVKTAKVSEKKFAKTLNVFGKIETRQTAFVSPRIAGNIEKLFVDEGDYVEKDKTVLFQLENLKLQQKVNIAKQQLSIILAVEKERKALLKKAEVDLDKKYKSFKRYKSLFEKHAISQEAFDAHEADYLTAQAELEHKKAYLALGNEEAKQGLINLKMAERDLSDSVAIAPISGYISEKILEIGEAAQIGKPIFKIDNTNDLEISAYLPAEYSSKIIKDSTKVEASLYGEPISQNIFVTYISPVVDPKLHIFEIKCKINAEKQKLMPGQSVQLKILLESASSAAVPTTSLIQKNDGWAVFTLSDDKAKLTPVKRGDDSNGWTSLLESPLAIGDKIISEGQFLLRENSLVSVID
jgi:RND family efflux transporter MFP subunit